MTPKKGGSSVTYPCSDVGSSRRSLEPLEQLFVFNPNVSSLRYPDISGHPGVSCIFRSQLRTAQKCQKRRAHQRRALRRRLNATTAISGDARLLIEWPRVPESSHYFSSKPRVSAPRRTTDKTERRNDEICSMSTFSPVPSTLSPRPCTRVRDASRPRACSHHQQWFQLPSRRKASDQGATLLDETNKFSHKIYVVASTERRVRLQVKKEF